ncbi:pectate lyase family protein [Rufibacter immobilis]|uniref:pectate lyase family protein n=1 Tax=Rufibacter immobilis TaxID=1348778 RepID=UPI0035E4BDA2
MNILHRYPKLSLLGIAFQMISLTGCAQNVTPSAAGSTGQASTGNPQALAFPGAEGFGKYTTGGRGGQVVVVTNLNDSGPGSLREAIRKKGPRIIVFALSGNIELQSPLDINNGDLTIAGQSAPGDGICLKNYQVSVKADNVILRYLRFRLGDAQKQQADALGANRGNNNLIIDHCSMSWATDECASFYNNTNFTLQWCLISESLNASVHQKGDHGYGGIWGGKGVSFHHNLIASHSSRTPRFSGSSTTPNTPEELVDFTNNVIYNWGQNNVYGGEKGRYNMVNNYYKAGPGTPESRKNRLVNPSQPYGKFFVNGNYIEGFPKISTDNWAGGVQAEYKDSARAETPFQVVAVNVQEPKAAYEAVLAHAGASLKRDAVDARVVQEVRTGNSRSGKKQNGIIDSPQDVGGFPQLKSSEAPPDKDQDGMPDAWEKAHKLDPANAADASTFTLHQQYSNIEVYLNSLVK